MFSASSSGISTSNSSSIAITSSTMSRLSAHRSSNRAGAVYPTPPIVPTSTLHVHPAVDPEHFTGDVGSFVAGKKNHRMGDFRRRPQPRKGYLLDHFGAGFARDSRGHVRLNKPRGYRIHPNISRCQLSGHGLGEANQPRFGGAVCRLPGISGLADDRGQIHDRPGALLHHRPGGCPDQGKCALEIGIELSIPVFFLGAKDQPVQRHPRVVDEHIEPPKLFHHAVHRLGAGGRVGDVKAQRSPLGPKQSKGLVGSRLVAGVTYHHLGAEIDKVHRSGPADAARSPGDQDHLSTEVAHPPLTPASARSRLCTSSTPKTGVSLEICLINPRRTFPGPSSTKWVTPCRRISSTHSTQRTGWLTCSRRSGRVRLGSEFGLASTLVTTGLRGGAKAAAFRLSFSNGFTGSISAQWNGAETCSGMTRFAPASCIGFAAPSTASAWPAITVCSGEL